MPIVPAANDAVVTVNAGDAFTVTVIACGAEDIFPAVEESVTLKVKEPLPPPVGVPLTTPVLLFKLNPAGSVAGVTVHVHGSVPPDSTSVVV